MSGQRQTFIDHLIHGMAIVVIIAGLYVQLFHKTHQCSDADVVSEKAWYKFKIDGAARDEIRSTQHYILMPDGVRLAVDVYLPKKWQYGETLPTMLHFTRYNRGWKVRWPQSIALGKNYNMRSQKYVEKFIAAGYAWVSVDVRGTGASGGTRPVDLSPQEVQDYQHVLRWVVQQPFCNGNVGSTGISYDGMAAMALAAGQQVHQGKPFVKAIAPLFSPFDVYGDLFGYGGAICTGMADEYTQFTYNVERNNPRNITGMPFLLNFMLKYMLNGVSSVKGEEVKLRKSIKDHQENWIMTDHTDQLANRDDPLMLKGGKMMSVDKLSPHRTAARLKQLGVSVYSIAGYYDSSAVSGATQLFNSLKGTKGMNKMTVGPWTHGCRRNCSPFRTKNGVCFDMYSDLVRFFDVALKGSENGLEKESSIFYYVQGEESWHSSKAFPPPDAKMTPLYLTSNNQLSESADSETIKFNVNYNTTTGKLSRWNLVQHLYGHVIDYPTRAEQAPSMLVFDGEVLDDHIDMVGVAELDLKISTETGDAMVFAYIEDVDPMGKVTYVTEGALRAVHRKLHKKHPYNLQSTLPYRSYLKKEREELSDQGDVMKLMLQPIAHRFLEGHRIRVSLTGADVDNFKMPADFRAPSSWNIHLEESKLIVPLM